MSCIAVDRQSFAIIHLSMIQCIQRKNAHVVGSARVLRTVPSAIIISINAPDDLNFCGFDKTFSIFVCHRRRRRGRLVLVVNIDGKTDRERKKGEVRVWVIHSSPNQIITQWHYLQYRHAHLRRERASEKCDFRVKFMFFVRITCGDACGRTKIKWNFKYVYVLNASEQVQVE